MKGKILKLKTGVSYYILEELLHNNKKYALGAECDLEKDNINEDELVVMEIKLLDNELIIDEIYDDNIAMEVTRLFQEKIQKSEE